MKIILGVCILISAISVSISAYTLKNYSSLEKHFVKLNADFDSLSIKLIEEVSSIRETEKSIVNVENEEKQSPVNNRNPVDIKLDANIYGNKDAEFSLVVYTDPECSYCKRFHSKPENVADMSGGTVNVITTLIPLINKGDVSFDESNIIECAGMYGGNYFFKKYLDHIMLHTRSNGAGVAGSLQPPSINDKIHEKIQRCASLGGGTNNIAANLKKAQEDGVNLTPITIVINNKTNKKTAVRGDVTSQQLLETIAAFRVEPETQVK